VYEKEEYPRQTQLIAKKR